MKIFHPLLALSSIALLFGSSANAAEPAPVQPTAQASVATDKDSALIKRGEYVAQLGDCVACHTAAKGALMAGGRELATPMGTIYSTNITPDPETGIGKYTFSQFDRAMRRGIAADGHNLYPAMPYPSYAKTSEEDMHALYAYLLQGLPPVKQANKPSEMSFPFNMRFGLSFWNFAFLDKAPFKPDASKDAVWNRGAYLVESLGHCGACHTPRGIAFQEKAMTDAGSSGHQFLAGETVEGWRAVSLRNLWTVEETAKLLKTGQNAFATVSGGMTEVIHNSTQHFTDADLTAIATYLKSLPAGERRSGAAACASERRHIRRTRQTVHHPRRTGLCPVLHRLPSPGWCRGQSNIPTAGAESDGYRQRSFDAHPHHADRLEDRRNENPSARLHHAGLYPAVRPGTGRDRELRAGELGQPP